MGMSLSKLREFVTDREAWRDAIQWGRKESDTTEWLKRTELTDGYSAELKTSFLKCPGWKGLQIIVKWEKRWLVEDTKIKVTQEKVCLD